MAFQISYKTVFELSIWHHHFLDPLTGPVFTPPPVVGASPEQTRLLLDYDVRNFLKVQPTEASVEVIKQRGLIYKNTNRGCLLAAKDAYTETDSGVKVSLVMNVTNPSFFNYTDFDFSAIGNGIFYLTNFGLSLPAPRTLLSGTVGNPYLRDLDRRTWNPRIVRIAQTTPGTDTTVAVIDLNTNPEVQVLALMVESAPDQPEYELDCRSLREGAYRLESPNITNTEFFLGLENQGGILGVVEIFLENLNDAQYDIRLAKK